MNKENTKYGYILLSRKIEEWQWHDQPTMMSMLIHCLCKANFKEKVWHGIKVERGSFITSIRSLAEFTGMDSKTVQKCLKNLEECETIKREITNKYTKITIINYNDYQENIVGKSPTRTPTKSPTRTPTNINKESNISPKGDILRKEKEKNASSASAVAERPSYKTLCEYIGNDYTADYFDQYLKTLPVVECQSWKQLYHEWVKNGNG